MWPAQKTRSRDSLAPETPKVRFGDKWRPMDNSLMVGLSAQQVLQQRMDLTANNLANMTTSGFKTERLVMRELSERPAAASDTPQDIAFVDAWMLQRDFSSGPMEQTGNPLDMAIDGEGFFVVQTADGEAYTRDGQFALDSQGRVTTHTGDLVMGDGGPLTIDPNAGPFSISREGSISQNGAMLGTFKTVAFDTPAALEKVGNNLWKATGEAPRAPVNSHVAAGFVEGSNVNAVSELTQMIEISRSYTAVAKMISQSDELRGASIEKLSRVG
ncbi:MAG: flagellar basal-body rod protein FlgF [Hyphomonadaceae bacterium]|nr:flagellar basal-body rod protein FlgF [Hyphomonadaceae bacterium]